MYINQCRNKFWDFEMKYKRNGMRNGSEYVRNGINVDFYMHLEFDFDCH